MTKKFTKKVWCICKVVVLLLKLIIALFMIFLLLLLLSDLRVPITFCSNIWLDPASLAVQLISSPKSVDRYIHKSIYMEIDTWWSNLKEILVRCVIIYINLQLGSWMLVFTIKNIKKTVTFISLVVSYNYHKPAMFLEMLKKLHWWSQFAFCLFFNLVVIKLVWHYTITAVKCHKPDLK